MLPPLPPFVPAAAVFDLDGVLVDSERLWAQAEEQVTVELGSSWEPAMQTALLGRGPAEAAAVLARLTGHPDPQEVEARLTRAALARFAGNVPAREGAVALVTAFAARMPVAVATNSRRAIAEASLTAAGLADLLPVVITADESSAAKPDPAPYLAACHAVAVAPARAVAFEDSPVGAQSARAAGCWVVGCPMDPTVRIDAAHAMVGSLDEIDVDAMLPGASTPPRRRR